MSPELQNALSSALSGRPAQEMNPELTQQYFQKSVATPMLRMYDQYVKPRLDQQFAEKNAVFSTRRGTESRRMLEGMNTDLTGQLANAVRQDYQFAGQLKDAALNRQASTVASERARSLQQNNAYLDAVLGYLNNSQMAIQPIKSDNSRKSGLRGSQALGSRLIPRGGGSTGFAPNMMDPALVRYLNGSL